MILEGVRTYAGWLLVSVEMMSNLGGCDGLGVIMACWTVGKLRTL